MVFLDIGIENKTSTNFPEGKVTAPMLSEHKRSTGSYEWLKHVFYYTLQRPLTHGESIAYSGFFCPQSYGLHLHIYCRLGFRVLCLVP